MVSASLADAASNAILGSEPSIRFFLAATTATYCIDNALYWLLAFILFIWSFRPSWQELAAQAPLAITLALLGREVHNRFSFQHLSFRNFFSPVKGVLLTAFVAFVALQLYEERIPTCPEELLSGNRRRGFPIGRVRAFILVVITLVLAYVLEIKILCWTQEDLLKDALAKSGDTATPATDKSLQTQQQQNRVIERFQQEKKILQAFYVVPAVWLGIFIALDALFQQKPLWNMRLVAMLFVFGLGVLIAELYTSSYKYKPRQIDERSLKSIMRTLRSQRERLYNYLHGL